MGNIFTDIATAVKATAEIRKARKAGADAVQIKPVYTVPMLKTGYFTWTMEATHFHVDDDLHYQAEIALFRAIDSFQFKEPPDDFMP